MTGNLEWSPITFVWRHSRIQSCSALLSPIQIRSCRRSTPLSARMVGSYWVKLFSLGSIWLQLGLSCSPAVPRITMQGWSRWHWADLEASVSRQSIGRQVGSTKLVHRLELQAHKFCVHLELPQSMKALIWNVHQASVISKDDGFPMLKVSTRLVHSHQRWLSTPFRITSLH